MKQQQPKTGKNRRFGSASFAADSARIDARQVQPQWYARATKVAQFPPAALFTIISRTASRRTIASATVDGMGVALGVLRQYGQGG